MAKDGIDVTVRRPNAGRGNRPEQRWPPWGDYARHWNASSFLYTRENRSCDRRRVFSSLSAWFFVPGSHRGFAITAKPDLRRNLALNFLEIGKHSISHAPGVARELFIIALLSCPGRSNRLVWRIYDSEWEKGVIDGHLLCGSDVDA
ncbi:hypothetical protein SERLA73DRAFT_79177 [Serpula lacrymans var. lacrymans S7.3]|uniref:Uncharacterized protein n=1 Tax=Serpula lacrymans var. lacrymans (strain S7.3) TaxID=936435 RepID=F8QFJ0_SERL3|nr:hypothetical protein SERLA73DRAFT_79177 [Serpula lacrymans var. lacrymans S7.3]